jgi:hypothetical protein
MSYSYFANEFFSVSQESNLHAETFEIDASAYDYVFEIDVGQASLNNLFNVRHFMQNSATQNDAGENNVDIDLTVNRQFIDSLLTTDTVSSFGTTKSHLGIETGIVGTIASPVPQQVGLRFLEVAAIKIFGHAKARAAISNDKDFYRGQLDAGSLVNQMITGLQESINAKKHDIFNQYVRDDRIEDNVANDVDANVQFNFDVSNLAIPMYFLSTLDTASNTYDLQNGPSTVGGNILTEGSMNVPILVKFVSDSA